ncbi:class I SAM-dependent rRNA methyltransferase [Elusimicrobiota bacterium]
MGLLRESDPRPVPLALARDLVRSLKRGHPWVYAEALRGRPPAPAGSQAVLSHGKRRSVARGFYDPASPLAFRSCSVDEEELDEKWALGRLRRALAARHRLFGGGDETTAYRILNGEGDGVPGLVLDRYGDHGVIQLDGPGPEGFWDVSGVADWAAGELSLKCVIFRPRKGAARSLVGTLPEGDVVFSENGVRFGADLVRGQKTGFFLDQRENRERVRGLAAGRTVLNLFGYTGGFSVYAGLGGAGGVTTVDLAKPAIAAAKTNWELNGLEPGAHDAVVRDAFAYLEEVLAKGGRTWDLIVADPPSFASSKSSVPQARASYIRLLEASAQACSRDGILVASSCSSHVSADMFLEICLEAVSKARRRATVRGVHGQPMDHPYPLACPELRYLKSVFLALN